MSSLDSGTSNAFPGYDPQTTGLSSASYLPGQQTTPAPNQAGGPGEPAVWNDGTEPEPYAYPGRRIETWKLYALRLFAVIPITLAGILVYDSMIAEPLADTAVVTGKHSHYRRRSGRSYKVQATGERDYSNGVSRRFYEKLRTGDTLRLKANPILGSWREATLVRGGRTLETYQTNGAVIWGLLAAALIVIPSIAFAEPHVILAWKEMPKLIALVEVGATCAFVFGGLGLAGII